MHIYAFIYIYIYIYIYIFLFFIRMKKWCSECVRIISLLKKIFGKHFEIFHEFADIANEFNRHVYMYRHLLWVSICILCM